MSRYNLPPYSWGLQLVNYRERSFTRHALGVVVKLEVAVLAD